MKYTLVTPDLARYFLSHNKVNRCLSKERVLRYANDIKTGKWKPNQLEPLGFDTAGNLIQGQHRLNAVIVSNTPQYFYIVENVDIDVMDVLDTGKARTAGDVLRIFNIENSNKISSGIKQRYRIESGIYSNSGNVNYILTNQDVLTKYNERPEYWQDIANKAQRLYKASLQIASPQVVFGMLSYWIDKGESTIFIEAVFKDDHSVLNAKGLNKFLTNQKIKRRKVTQSEVINLFFKYHNLWKQGKNAVQYLLMPDEKVKTF
jgi:hypothetical protein